MNQMLLTPGNVMRTAIRPDIVMQSGSGSWLVDQSGKHYLDFLQGWAVNSLGHCHPVVVDALTKQAQQLINPSPAFYNAPMLRFSELLAELSSLDQVFFCSTGAEANEGAIKLARKWGALHKDGASEFITFSNSFHGRTLATMSASGKPNWDHLFEPKVPGFKKLTFNSPSELAAGVTDKTVAIMLELVQGEGGVIPADLQFVETIRSLCQEKNILLIVDEVQTGIGRTGTMFCFQNYNLRPDIVTLGKGIGSGVPLAALLSTNRVSVFEAGDQGGTYNGNPLMAAVGHAVVSYLSQPIIQLKIADNANRLHEALSRIASLIPGAYVRGKGLLLAIVFPHDIAQTVVDEALTDGLLLNAPRPNVLRFMPSLVIDSADIDEMAARLHRIVARL
ncbi:aminotransferase class III-fold pyridoxal phosphate-dependent enzyme [bacterium]|nr:aminotransferase class III-fold pyridoxal phosphate-dependent enzyme [bacterium]